MRSTLLNLFLYAQRRSFFFAFACVVCVLPGCKELAVGLPAENENLGEVSAPILGYTLVWEDQFDVPVLDVERWRYRTDCKSQSCQRPENVLVENGYLKVLLKKESYNNKPFTGGGIITRKSTGYGYYEIRAKMNDGYGWHEAFWATGRSGFDDPNPLTDVSGGRTEIDCFEHFGNFTSSLFQYGAIDWSDMKGSNLHRGSIGGGRYETVVDLSKDFHTYGFEYTPDYINFFFDGKLIRTIDIRFAPQHDTYLWITCIATEADATDNGVMMVDYIRAYEISPTEYAVRKIPFVDYLDSLRGPQHSQGTDLWIEAEDFAFTNNWIVDRGGDHSMVLRGLSSPNPTRTPADLKAMTGITVNETVEYKLWVRSQDFDTQQGYRKFKVIIKGEESPVEFGTHGKVGYGWQTGGVFTLKEGMNVVELYDSSQYFARCDKILLTTDMSFVPQGIGGISNVEHIDPRP